MYTSFFCPFGVKHHCVADAETFWAQRKSAGNGGSYFLGDSFGGWEAQRKSVGNGGF